MPGTGPLPGAELAVSELEEHSLLLENGTQKVLELGAKSKVGVKHAAVTTWLSVSPNGTAALLELGKLKVTHQLGVQLRDLRLLDPQLANSYPSAILARDRALVLNLEYIKCIVTMDMVYVTGLTSPLTLQFVHGMQQRLAAREAGAEAGGPHSARQAFGGDLKDGGVAAPSHLLLGGDGEKRALRPPPQELPFELKVLEIALECVSGDLEQLAEELESAAHPALDNLTSKITTSALERVRRIKSRMVRLNTRVETLREVLEKFLNDDSDMKDLHLTAKEREWQEAQLQNVDSWPEPGLGQVPLDQTMTPGDEFVPASPSFAPTPATGPESARWNLGKRGRSRRHSDASSSSSSSSSSDSSLGDDEDVAMVEMLLEPYFMQLDNTYNKLQTLYEYIDDTEDFINLELDSKRNQIIRMQLVLTSFNASVALVTAFTSLFAMNLEMKPADEWPGQGPYAWFLSISLASGLGAIFCFVGVLVYARYKKIL
uniref:Magnesium transporter n=1 Tax=Auxenochlorella protothecoides TaxID=3075 RepID=A0A1D2AE65_AUXPR